MNKPQPHLIHLLFFTHTFLSTTTNSRFTYSPIHTYLSPWLNTYCPLPIPDRSFLKNSLIHPFTLFTITYHHYQFAILKKFTIHSSPHLLLLFANSQLLIAHYLFPIAHQYSPKALFPFSSALPNSPFTHSPYSKLLITITHD